MTREEKLARIEKLETWIFEEMMADFMDFELVRKWENEISEIKKTLDK